MRPVYMITGGITKFKKANPEMDFRYYANPYRTQYAEFLKTDFPARERNLKKC